MKCPDRFSRTPIEHYCIGDECVAYHLIKVYDPDLYQAGSAIPNPASEVVAHTPWCQKYNNRIGYDILVGSTQ